MLTYLLKRILAMIPTLLGITLITFFIINLAPGDPVGTGFGAKMGAGANAGEGGAQSDRQADAVKAKKKLLGILAENPAVIAWSTARPEGTGGNESDQPMDQEGQFATAPAFQRAIALGGGKLFSAGDDGQIHVLDPATGEELRSFGPEPGPDGPRKVGALAATRDGAYVAIGDDGGRVSVWEVASGAAVGTVEPDDQPVHDVAFTPDGTWLVSGSGSGAVRMHDGQTGEVRRELSDHVNGVYAVAISPDGTRAWTGGFDRTLREWDLGTGAVRARSKVHGQGINDIVVSADGRLLATACDDRAVRILDTSNLDVEKVHIEGHYKAVTSVALAADSRTVFSGSSDETLRSWDVATGAPLTRTTESTGTVLSLLLSPDGAQLWSAGKSWYKVGIATRYFTWVSRLARFDFDKSFKDQEPVITKIGKALPVTLGLNVLALLLIYAISIPMGVAGAVKRGQAFDNISSVILFLLYSIPNFWLATILIMTVSSARTFDILPSVGMHAEGAEDLSVIPFLLDWAAHLVLPVIVLTYAGFASLSRYARTSMLETIGQDYVRTARAKGLPERIVVWKHAFRNSLITIVTLVANLLPAMIGGSVIVEYIFTIDGMGKLGFDAILARDYPVVMAIVTFSAFLTLAGILVSDILYTIVDPRVTTE